jgi:hypothetical protein
MAISPNNAFVAGQVLTAQECNNLPFGVVGLVERTTGSFTVTTAVADVTAMSVTFTALANRIYKFSTVCTGQKLTNQGWTGLFLTNTANFVYAAVYATAPANGYYNLSSSSYLGGFTPGSITVKLRAQCENDTSTILAQSLADKIQLIVEDMGPI